MRYLLLALMTVGCANLTQRDKQHQIKCYSGVVKIYEGESTGSVTANKVGIEFKEKSSQDYVAVTGDCIIRTLRSEQK